MRIIKKYWRLVIGLSFIYAGLSELMAGRALPGYGVFALGCYFIVWHAVTLLLKHHGRNRNRPES